MKQTSYTSWQSKYTFFLSGCRKQSCQQRQSLRTRSAVLDVSCANGFYSKAAVPDFSRGSHSLEQEPLAPGAVPVPAPSCSQSRERVAQDLVWIGFEYFQGWRLQKLSVTPASELDHSWSKKGFFLCLISHLSGYT